MNRLLPFISVLSFLLSFIPLLIQAQVIKELNPTLREEIKTLGADKRIQAGFDFIKFDNMNTLEEHIQMTEIPAPPFKEQKRAAYFKNKLEEFGLDSVWIDEVGNVLGLLKGKKGDRTVVLDAHLDTVFPEETDVTVKMKGDTLYAPGISDDTRGLAIVLAVVKSMMVNQLRGNDDILFIGSVGEEGLGDLRGVKHLFREEGPRIDSWISIDGGTIGRVNNKGLGSYRYKVSFIGPGGHSWGAFGIVNPHHALGSAIQRFVRDANSFTLDGPRTSYNIGRIGGGTSINSVPFESWMEIDMRSESPERLDIMEGILERAVSYAVNDQNEMMRRGDSLRTKIEKIGNRPSGELSIDLPLIQRAMASTAFFGKRPELTRGSTNSNIPISLGIPAVTIGRGGRGQNAHSLNEWWLDDEGYKATQLAMLLLLAESGLAD